MRQHLAVILVVAGLLAGAAVLVGVSLAGGASEPVLRWQQADEVVVAPAASDPSAIESVFGTAAREALADQGPDLGAGERREVVLHGRVVDSFAAPVRDARVWLGLARGGPREREGRQLRVPEPVQTDADGRFAFEGQVFRTLRVSLLVAHPGHAAARFDRNLGESRAEMDVGDLVLTLGGTLAGRVTDLDGIGVPGAEVALQPENENRLRFERDRAQLFAPGRADPNGCYRFDHVPAGDWRVSATAPRHEEGRSGTVVAEEGLQVEVDDIRLGPGYELAGVVTDQAGRPVAAAAVVVRARRSGRESRFGRGGPGANWGNAGEHRASTDCDGRFHLDHLPRATLDVTVEKEGYLRAEQREVDATLERALYVTLLDGLKVAGVVQDAVTGVPVELFAVRAQWLRDLPSASTRADAADPQRRARAPFPDGRREPRSAVPVARPGPGGPGPGGGPWVSLQTDPGPPSEHAQGHFLETGLQEGVYALVVRSPDHARYRSDEFELRLGVVPAPITVRLLRGLTVGGVVRDRDGREIAGASVELRPAPARGGGDRSGFARLDMADPAIASTTDAQGRFVIAHAAPGDYRVVASARGHDDASTAPFTLTADLGELQLELGSLGALAGRVLGATTQQFDDIRIIALPLDERGGPLLRFRGGSPFGSVNPDGTYRIDELSPGGYAVRAFTGKGMRSLFAQFFGATLTPDVTVRAGETATFDVTLLLPDTGVVHGSVLHDGQPAAGFQVSLRRQDGAEPPDPVRGLRAGPFRMGFDFNAAVGQAGQFTIGDVPAGSYRLTVRDARRGSGVLHSEAVVVQARATSEVTISLITAAIRGQVTVDDGTPLAELDGSVMLLPGLTDLPDNLGEWRRNNASFDARVEDGRFEIERLPPGSYLAVLQVRGRMRATAQVFASVGASALVSIAAGKKSAASAGQRR